MKLIFLIRYVLNWGVYSPLKNNIREGNSTQIFREAFMEVDENECNFVVFKCLAL